MIKRSDVYLGPLSFRLLKSTTSDCSSPLCSRLPIEAALSSTAYIFSRDSGPTCW